MKLRKENGSDGKRAGRGGKGKRMKGKGKGDEKSGKERRKGEKNKGKGSRGCCTHPIRQSKTNLACDSALMFYACVKFHPDRFIVSPLRSEKSQVLPHFQLQHSAMAPSSGIEKNLNAGPQLGPTNLPLSNVVSSFMSLNGLAMLCS